MPANQAEMQDIELASIRQELTERFYNPSSRNEFSLIPWRRAAHTLARMPRDRILFIV
jgi:hypothetical protein